jgi:hypothetical protein
MKKTSKLIVQFDDEFMWLWNKDHIFWKKHVEVNQSPEAFFKTNRVLETADAFFTVLSDVPWSKYTDKPIFYMPLPQFFRYKINKKIYCSQAPDKKYVVIMRHSVNSASIDHLIKNVVKKLKYPVILFTTSMINEKERDNLLAQLPERSKVYGRLNRDHYMHFLKEGFVALDDNEGYAGWSRFALECSIMGIPCIGSTEAVKHINSELYVKHKDYKTQRKLIRKIYEDLNYYRYVKYYGVLSACSSLSNANLVTKLLKIAFIDLDCKYVEVSNEEYLELEFIQFMKNLRTQRIPNRPKTGEQTFDTNCRRIITLVQWDELYGRFMPILNNPELYAKLMKEVKNR